MWTLRHQVDGFYSVMLAGTDRALSVASDVAKPGAKVETAPFLKRDTQIWRLQQNEDGTYTLLTKSGSEPLALDVSNCQLHDGVPLQLWKSLGNECQKWSFRR